jgi:predicted nucleotidyltransferase
MWNEDYRDMLCALNDARVDFILVGAYALAAHGFPRATLDIDLWVRRSPDNARTICDALTKFGAPATQISAADFEKEDMVVQIGVAPRRIDFVTSISGLSYDEAARNAVEREIDGVTLKILSVEDFVRNKLASGRPKDLVDAELLRKRAQ